MSRSIRVCGLGLRSITSTVRAGCSLDPAFACPSRWFASKSGGNKHKSLSQVLAAQQRRAPTGHSKPPTSPSTPTSTPPPVPPTPPIPPPAPAAPSLSSTSPPSSPPPVSSSPPSSSPSPSTTPSVPTATSSEPLSTDDDTRSSRSAPSGTTFSELISRLTRTENDRQVLRQTSRLVAVLMLITLVVNPWTMSRLWDERWNGLLSWSPPVDAVETVTKEEEEDERLVEALYSEHQRWLQQREHDELVARLEEEERQLALVELAALEAEQAAQRAAAESTKETVATTPSETVTTT